MEFEWDAAKSDRNLRERGLPFDLAPALLARERIEWCDIRQPCGEVRINALGETEGRVFFVTYTLRRGCVRIISFRKANQRESDGYRQIIP